MDNKTSAEVEQFIAEQNTDVQYTALGKYCTPAEKAGQTYQSCFKSTAASLPQEFPISYWCRFLPQVHLSINCQHCTHVQTESKTRCMGSHGRRFSFRFNVHRASRHSSVDLWKAREQNNIRPQRKKSCGTLEHVWIITERLKPSYCP